MPRLRTTCYALLLCAPWLVLTPDALAQDAASPPNEAQPADPVPKSKDQPKLTARELVVLHVDKYGDYANDPRRVETTLGIPVNHKKRNKRVSEQGGFDNTPCPVGVITFEGRIDTPFRVRMNVIGSNGFIHAHWPKDLSSDEMVQWLSMKPAGKLNVIQQFSQTMAWLEPLRESDDRLWLNLRDATIKERFLLYDPSFTYTPALGVTKQDGNYHITAKTEADRPELALLLGRSEAGWSSSVVDQPWDGLAAPMGMGTQSGDTENKDATLDKALEPLAALLEERGYNSAEIELARGMIDQAGLRGSRLSLVYVLPEDRLEQGLRLRITPEPDRLIRTAVVVVTSVDPDVESRIKELITRLGSDHWRDREAAQQELESLGQAAIKQLQENRNHADPEIAFRVRQVLATYDYRFGR